MRTVFSFLAVAVPAAVAYPQISTPGGGGSWDSGSVTVEWTDTGSPAISQLTTYTLQLMVGGNEATNSEPVAAIIQTGTFTSGVNKATGTLDPGVAGPTKNGFYLKMTCNAAEGGSIIVFSDRFSIPSMTGTTQTQFAQAASALGSNTAGPAVQNGVVNNAGGAAAGAGAGAAGAGVPYNSQSGLTKYAPMQSVPPTSISLKTASPLYPTSSYVLATTFLPLASIVTTVTVAQTFSVSSIENTVAAQAQPSDDMAKFLARWKD